MIDVKNISNVWETKEFPWGKNILSEERNRGCESGQLGVFYKLHVALY